MLWYKSWLETRWRFVIGLVVLMLTAAGDVFAYPHVIRLLADMPTLDLSGEIGRRVAEQVALSRDYRGYVWSQFVAQEMFEMWALFAVLIGTGGLLAQSSPGGGALFTLSLPVTRTRLLGIRAATGLLELLALAIVPPLLVALLSPAVGQSYSIVDALIHSVCIFIGGTVYFSLAVLLSTVFIDVWRPMLLVLCVVVILWLVDVFVPDVARFSLVRVMTGELYFRGGGVPWVGLLFSAGLSMALLVAATRNITRQDF